MSHSLPYLLGILLVVFVIDFTLRALPFKILEPLRESRFVRNMAVWMPPGILLILVLATLSDNTSVAGSQWWAATIATVITVVCPPGNETPPLVERQPRDPQLHPHAELALEALPALPAAPRSTPQPPPRPARSVSHEDSPRPHEVSKRHSLFPATITDFV